MKFFIFTILFLFFVTPEVHSQKVNQSKVKKPAQKITRKKSYFRVGVNSILWQEQIGAERGGTHADLDSEFRGFGLITSYQRPLRDLKWEQSYAAELLFGSLISKGNPIIQDALKNQPWYSLSFKAGMVYKNTRFSELAFYAPISLRSITWKLDDPSLHLDKNNSISYGLSFAYTSYLTPRNALTFAVTSQIAWSATQWTLGWNYKL